MGPEPGQIFRQQIQSVLKPASYFFLEVQFRMLLRVSNRIRLNFQWRRLTQTALSLCAMARESLWPSASRANKMGFCLRLG